jgi:iron complex transport system substrate-binding protein
MRKRVLLTVIILAMHLLLPVSAKGQERFLTDEIGRKVKIPHSPKRIISLAPSITEILFALGLTDEIAGVTDFCDYPEIAAKKPRIGGFTNASIEKIVSLKPDLIIGIKDGNRMDALQGLNDLGFSIYVIDPKGVDGVTKTIKNIGEVAGREDESIRIVRSILSRKERIASLTRTLPKPKVFFQIGTGPTITVGRGTLADDLIRLSGGRSVSEDESTVYPFYSIETLLSKAPEMIIMSSMEGKKDHSNQIEKWQNWKSIPAVKRNAIYVVDSNLVDRPTPRIIEGLEAMVRIIHPEVLGKKR